MKPSLLRWLRLVAPPDWSIAALFVLCGVFEIFYLWLRWQMNWQQPPTDFFRGRDLICILAALVLGNYRISAFHPQFDHEYLSWLWLTPWKADKPLPKGPLYLVPQDLVAVGLITSLMYHHATFPLVLVPLAFLLGYYLALGMSLWAIDLRWPAYALSALVGLVVHVAVTSPVYGLGMAAVVYLFAWLCIRQTLVTFPWGARATAWRQSIRQRRQALTSGQRESVMALVNPEAPELSVPWPFNQLHARPQPLPLDRGDRVALALLLSWWVFVLLSIPRHQDFVLGVGVMLYMSLLGAAVILRLAIYCMLHWPPISLWGRIWTFRWIIPGYDYVLLTPLATLGLAIGVPAFFVWLRLPPVAVLSLSLSPFLMMAMLGGPRIERWRLTSHSRLAPGIKNPQLVEEI